jgi:hypothetical protein
MRVWGRLRVEVGRVVPEGRAFQGAEYGVGWMDHGIRVNHGKLGNYGILI